jgi:flavin-dependent dehydrogenase
VTAQAAFAATNVIDRAALFLDGHELIARSMPRVEGLPPSGRVIPRKVIDHWVVQAARRAGAQVWEGCRVTRFDVYRDAATVATRGPAGERTFCTRLLLGADGSNSTVARLLRGRGAAADGRIIAVRGYYEGVAGPANRADLYFNVESFPGYYWLFPTGPDTANVGVGMVLETFPPTQDHLREMLARLVASDPALGRRLGGARPMGPVIGYPLTTYDPRLPLVDDRVMLLGDAAGLINPLNGEGIQHALLSGRWAAEVARAAAGRNDFSATALAPYADRVARELRYDMALARLIVQGIRNRTLTPVWLQALQIIAARARKDPAYSHITGGILAGLVPVREALGMRVVWGTAQQAALSLGWQAALCCLGSPRRTAAAGLRAAVAVTSETARHPAGAVRWGLGLVDCAAELALQAAKDLFGPPSRPEGPVRLTLSVGGGGR